MLQTIVQGYVDAISVATSLRPSELPVRDGRRLAKQVPSASYRAAVSIPRRAAGWGKRWLTWLSRAGTTGGAGRPARSGQASDRAARAGAHPFFAADHYPRSATGITVGAAGGAERQIGHPGGRRWGLKIPT